MTGEERYRDLLRESEGRADNYQAWNAEARAMVEDLRARLDRATMAVDEWRVRAWFAIGLCWFLAAVMAYRVFLG